jgi:S1-C subfamily serine protease
MHTLGLEALAVWFIILPQLALEGMLAAALAGEVSQPAGVADVVQRVRPAVITIRVEVEEVAGHGRVVPRTGSSHGSGFFISSDGYAVTNAHVVTPEHAIVHAMQINMQNGGIYDAKLVGADPVSDLAVIKVDGRGELSFVAFAETSPRVGDDVVAIGSPFGLAGTVARGIFSPEGRDLGYGRYDYIQIYSGVRGAPIKAVEYMLNQIKRGAPLAAGEPEPIICARAALQHFAALNWHPTAEAE